MTRQDLSRPAKPGVGLTVGALGVVFGDIGTSPLYSLHYVLGVEVHLTPTSVIGLTTLVLWTIVVVVKREGFRLDGARKWDPTDEAYELRMVRTGREG